MPDCYYFFFSYASANHENAKWVHLGSSGNYLDEFIEALCHEVSDKAGRSPDRVGCRDKVLLKMGDFWGPELVRGLQKSRVLLALISRHYLKSHNCGREIGFFHKRLELFKQVGGDANQARHILPIFWEDVENCLKEAHPNVSSFIKRYNFTQQGLPANYPQVGLSQICKLRHGTAYEEFCHALATRIVELAESPHVLPELPGNGDFNDLDSLYAELEKEIGDVILSGPGNANVVYVVGTRSEMESIGLTQVDSYSEKREEWRPFLGSPGATVALLTTEGSNQAGFRQLLNLGLPENVGSLIATAKHKNSPILLVLDRFALNLPQAAAAMTKYADENFDHCGLVTAGGSEVPQEKVEKVFGIKCLPGYPHHRWDVPKDRYDYVTSVATVLSGIKQQLMMRGNPVSPFASAAVPGLSVPAGK